VTKQPGHQYSRNSALLDSLFPRIRQGVLAATLTQPRQWWSLSGLARHLGTSPSSLQRELASLVRAGILKKRSKGCSTLYKALRTSVNHHLRGLFERVRRVDARTVTSSAPQKRSGPPEVSANLMSRYDRERLHDEVWSQPTREVAARYRISDVALGKTCRKLYIPLPGRGYWNKKAAGKPVRKRPPLPAVTVRARSSRAHHSPIYTA
jgi:hypothetical protein